MNEIRIDRTAMPACGGERFEGWGSSFCWWPNRIGSSDRLAAQAARLFYSPEEGLGLNIIRFNIGGGDDPAHRHIRRTDSAMPGYLIKQADGSLAYDWEADWRQRKVLVAAVRECGGDAIVEAFSNSPPYFMTNSGCSSGARDPGDDNLRADQYGAFADYLASVVAHYEKEEGIRIQSIDPMNEPASSYWKALSEKQEGCHFSPGESQSRMLLAMREALDRHGLDHVLLCGTDETDIDVQIDSFRQLSPQAQAALARIDVHSYLGSRRDELRSLASRHGKKLWMSEVDGGDVAGSGAGEMGAALALARRIITDMNGLCPSAWVIWQLIDSHISSEGFNGNRDSGRPDTRGGYWGVATADHDREEILLTKKYWAFWQFSRFIRPGMYLLKTDAATGTAQAADCLAAFDADAGSLVIVAVNDGARPRFLKADVGTFCGCGRDGPRFSACRTSGSLLEGENAAPVAGGRVRYGRLKARLPGNSITSFVLSSRQGSAGARL